MSFEKAIERKDKANILSNPDHVQHLFNPKKDANFWPKKLYTSNHTCNQNLECKTIPQATPKSTKNG